jgi:hypothetical protein
MYGKIHQSFFGSSIVETDLETRFVFIAMIVLSDANGRLDVTRHAFARQINAPLEIVDKAIAVLAAPDELSRSPEHEGRRIIPIDAGRNWGWIVVNKAAYREASDDERHEHQQEQWRKRQRRHREKKKRASPPPTTSPTDSDTHTDSDTYTDTTLTHAHAQSRTVTEKRDKAAKRKRKKPLSFADDSREMQLARLLRDLRKEAGCLYTEPDLQRWAATFSEVLNVDHRDPAIVERIIRHVTADKQKRKFLQSPGALRGRRKSDDAVKFDGWADEVTESRDQGKEHDFAEFELRD